MKKFNFNDLKSCCNEVSIDKLNKIDGGHYIYVKYYNGCNGKLIKTVKKYSNECKCNTYQGTLKVKVY